MVLAVLGQGGAHSQPVDKLGPSCPSAGGRKRRWTVLFASPGTVCGGPFRMEVEPSVIWLAIDFVTWYREVL